LRGRDVVLKELGENEYWPREYIQPLFL